MSLFTASDICLDALLDIGAVTAFDPEPEPREMKIALRRLSLLLSHVYGTARMPWARPETVKVPLIANTQSYDLSATSPPLQMVENAWLDDGAGNRSPLDVLLKSQFEGGPVPTQAGTPGQVYFQIGLKLIMWVIPIPLDSDVGKSIVLDGQTFSSDLSAGGKIPHGLPEAWQLYLVKLLAHDVGGGAIRRIPLQERQDLLADSMMKRSELETWASRPNRPWPRVTRPRRF